MTIFSYIAMIQHFNFGHPALDAGTNNIHQIDSKFPAQGRDDSKKTAFLHTNGK